MDMTRGDTWELQGLRKVFGPVVANGDISLTLAAHQIHGLVGENGSGKSTLIKILSGAHQPDAGAILRNGVPVRLADPHAARDAGIATVFQEFSLVPSLGVAENIYLGRLPMRRGQVDWRSLRSAAAAILADMNVAIEVDATVEHLSVAEQQLVEIAKALAADASLIILDEPTTALGAGEIARLHDLLRRLRERGRALLYVSHRLEEVVELVDCVTVLKDGNVASPAARTLVDVSYIVRAMVGDVAEHYPKARNATDDVLLKVENLTTREGVSDLSFDLHRGEVFGLGGVLGSGRTEVARALFGIDKVVSGGITINGRAVSIASPADAIAAGIGLVPENRKTDGLFFNFTGFPNISSASLHRLGRHGLISLAREAAEGRRLVRDLEITPTAETREVGYLSGGNQQKVVIARWLFANAEILILDEPTQGIDIAARVAVYQLINGLTAAGKGIILISSDDDALLAMSDRVGVMNHGRLVSIRSAADLSEGALMRFSTGAAPAEVRQ
jgi:ABC-type sugar transport system ATPase subunit